MLFCAAAEYNYGANVCTVAITPIIAELFSIAISEMILSLNNK